MRARLWSCGHTFCNACIAEHFAGDGRRQCPTCRKVAPEDAIKNFALDTLVDLLSASGAGRDDEEQWEVDFSLRRASTEDSLPDTIL